MDATTTRINSLMREKFVGRTVRIVGKCVNPNGSNALLDDGHGSFSVSVPVSYKFNQGQDYEIVGRINPDYSLMTKSAVLLGSNVDYKLVDDTVRLMQEHEEIFA